MEVIHLYIKVVNMPCNLDITYIIISTKQSTLQIVSLCFNDIFWVRRNFGWKFVNFINYNKHGPTLLQIFTYWLLRTNALYNTWAPITLKIRWIKNTNSCNWIANTNSKNSILLSLKWSWLLQNNITALSLASGRNEKKKRSFIIWRIAIGK